MSAYTRKAWALLAAYHEAGHVLMNLLLDTADVSVCVEYDDRTGDFATRYLGKARPSGLGFSLQTAIALQSLAGYAAVRTFWEDLGFAEAGIASPTVGTVGDLRNLLKYNNKLALFFPLTLSVYLTLGYRVATTETIEQEIADTFATLEGKGYLPLLIALRVMQVHKSLLQNIAEKLLPWAQKSIEQTPELWEESVPALETIKKKLASWYVKLRLRGKETASPWPYQILDRAEVFAPFKGFQPNLWHHWLHCATKASHYSPQLSMSEEERLVWDMVYNFRKIKQLFVSAICLPAHGGTWLFVYNVSPTGLAWRDFIASAGAPGSMPGDVGKEWAHRHNLESLLRTPITNWPIQTWTGEEFLRLLFRSVPYVSLRVSRSIELSF